MDRVKVQNSDKNYKGKKISPSMSFPIRWLSILSVNSLMLFNVSFPLLILPSFVNGGEVIAQTDPNFEAERLYNQGRELLKQGTAESLRETIIKWEEALLLFRKTRNLIWEATTLLGIGRVYDILGEKQKALNYYEQALPIYREVGDKRGEAITLNNIGSVYDNLGEKQKALNYYEQALPLFQQVKDKAGEVITLNNIGVVYSDLGEKQKALNYYEQVLPIVQELDDPRQEANTLNNIGTIYDDLGEKQKALKKYKEALPLFQQAGDRRREAIALNNIGVVYSDLGEKQTAIDYFEQALPILQQAGDRRREAGTLNNIGRVYDTLGEKQKALNYYDKTLSLFRQVDDPGGEARTLNNIGSVYNTLGEKQKALDFYQQALSISQEVGDKGGEANILNNIGHVYNSLGEKQKALKKYNQALPILREVDAQRVEAITLNNIGIVYNDLGEKQKALDFYQQALPLRRRVGDKGGEATTLNNIGSVYNDLGEKQKALDFYQQALPILQEVEDKATEAIAISNIASVKRDQGKLTESLTFIEKSLEIIEELRTKIVAQDLRTSYFATVQDNYQFYIDILMQLHEQNPDQGFDAKALHASERRRARSLLELLTEANANIYQDVDKGSLQKQQSLLQKFDATEKERLELVRSDYKPEQLEKIKQELATLQTEYEQLQNQIKQTSPGYAALKYPQPLNLQQIQQQVLDDNTILLEYSLGEDRSYLWAVTKNSITSYELPPQAEIETAAQQFIDMLTAPDLRSSPQDLPKAAQALSEIILQPVASQLENQQLLIVSDGILQYVPFAALSVPGKNTLLLSNSKIVNAPSASTIAINRNQTANRQTAGKTIAILADPVFTPDDERVTGIAENNNSPETVDSLRGQRMTRAARYGSANWERLAGTRIEAEAIVAQVSDPQQRTYALDFEASKEKATDPILKEYKFVHFATHGFFNGTQPELSGIVMSLVDQNGNQQNGFLYLQDVFNLKLSAELVVLSACETGLGEEVKGEGIVGLTRGFMYAGTPRVVVSLWKVNDEATAELMTLFYQKMLVEKMKPVEALRAAQIEMLNSEKWQDPEYWAAFTLQGEWQ